jgi:hypothetical protein
MMMNNRKATIAALTTAALVFAGVDRAASETAPTPKAAPPQTEMQQKQTPLEKAAAADFSRISTEGSDGFLNLIRARRAIFDGRVEDAKKEVHAAEAAFDKSKTDLAVFTKAEADLKAPAGKTVPAATTVGAAPSDKASSGAASADQMKTPVAWLPVDGAMAISEDFATTPEKKAALADANKNLKGGDRSGAIEQLKLAGLIVDVTLGVVPLQQTTTDVHQAAVLIGDGKYYEASQLLKKIQDSERFDSRTISGQPSGK